MGRFVDENEAELSVRDILDDYGVDPFASIVRALALVARQFEVDGEAAKNSLFIVGYFLLDRRELLDLCRLIAVELESRHGDKELLDILVKQGLLPPG